jgi:NMD protein affecting ribosome stability and mRNA decay
MKENKLETCHHCGKQKENCYHGYIAMCIPIPEAEAKKEKWNLIDAFHTYGQRIISENLWMLVAIDWPSTQEEFNNKIKTDPEFSEKWFTKTWWKNLEREDLTSEEFEELDRLSMYDQLISTVGRGVQCDDCGRKEAELYEIYYPKTINNETNKRSFKVYYKTK